MNIREFAYLITAIITLESACYVFYLNRHSLTNRVYSLLSADFAVISFILYKISGADSCNNCLSWYGSNTIPGCLVPSLSLHLSLCITGYKKSGNPLTMIIIYLPAMLFIIFMSYADFFRSQCFETSWGWETVISFNSNYAYLFILYANLMLAASAIIAIRWRFLTNDAIEKVHAKSIIIPYMAGITGMFLCPYFLNIQGHEFANLLMDVSGHILFVCFVVGIRISIHRYNFMKLTPFSPAVNIIRGLKDPVLLMGLDNTIIHHNKLADELFHLSTISDKTSVFNIFDCPITIQKVIDDIISGKAVTNQIRCSITTGLDYQKSYLLDIQSIHNQSGVTSGIFIQVKNDAGIIEFKKIFKITDRQLDLIYLVVSGMTNREISEKMNIAEKTVENHLFNIYNKLGIDNKIQLLRLTQKYNIITG